MIRVGYIGIHSRIRISSPTCGRALGYPKHPRYVSRMYPACIPHVSWLPLRIHVSRMYPACIPHVSRMYLDYLWGYMYLACISHVSRMSPSYQIHLSLDDIRMTFEIHVSHHVSRNLGCIPHVSWSPPQASKLVSHCLLDHPLQIHVSRMYPACILHLRYVPLRIHMTIWDTCISHVSWKYPACIPHVSSNQCRYIYPWLILHECIVN